MILLAIDPGPTRSAFVIYGAETSNVYDRSIDTNEELLARLRGAEFRERVDLVLIEKVESFGMAVGKEVFETVYWSGRFAEAAQPMRVERMGRKAIKLTLCNSVRAKDSNIRQALIDRFGGVAAIGKKHSQGPLYGISRDKWSALALAVAYVEGSRT